MLASPFEITFSYINFKLKEKKKKEDWKTSYSVNFKLFIQFTKEKIERLLNYFVEVPRHGKL